MNTRILNKLKRKFPYAPQNWEKLVELWKSDQPITFYSWECPPRQIAIDSINGKWVNFDIDIQSVVKGKKLDKFTELPRLTSEVEREKWFIDLIKTNPNAQYVKIIADTNSLYLYPKSKQVLGEEKLKELSQTFKNELNKEAFRLFGKNKPKIILYTKLFKAFQSDYEALFNLIYGSFTENNSSMIPQKVTSRWSKRIMKHIGLDQEDYPERLDLLKRVIASYVAEGVVFELLSQSGKFPNPVWANSEEPPNNVITTEVYRSRLGIPLLPVLYFIRKEV